MGRLQHVWSEEGPTYILRACATKLFDHSAGYLYHKFLHGTATFQYDDKTYQYFVHRYNKTWRNERAVEIPIMLELIGANGGKRILEIGNVLSHYVEVRHDIVDKYECGPGIINEDVVAFRPSEKYDLIVSISTLEHIGWDEEPREAGKSVRAMENLKACLAPGGLIAASFPLGYNDDVDRLLRESQLGFTKRRFLSRHPVHNQWAEISEDRVAFLPYNKLLFHARELVIGVFESPRVADH